MVEKDRNRSTAGAVLVLLGLGLLALQFVEGFGEAVLFFVIGGAFVAGYLWRRAYGLLIPGGILLGLGLGQLGANSLMSFGDFSGIGLGLGFVSIYVIALIYEGRSHWWPLIPGLILIVSGFAEGSEAVARLLSRGWPLILIFIGLMLLAGGFRMTGRKQSGEQS